MFVDEKCILVEKIHCKNGLGLLLEDPFDGMTPAKKDIFEDISQLRSLTDSFVFCPKCGKRNTYELSRSGAQLIYFCKRCSAKLNAYWDSHQNGEMTTSFCRSCQQPTFKDLKYCITCGSQQKEVVVKRSGEISRTLRDKVIDGDEATLAACDCCMYGPLDALFGVIFRRGLKRLPKSCLYVFLAVMLIIGILLIVFYFMICRELG